MGRSDDFYFFHQILLGGIGWPLILAFAVVVFVYFLAPPLGYDPKKRVCLAISLWLFVATMALIMLRIALVALVGLEDSMSGPGGVSSGSREVFIVVALISSFLETGAFFLAIILFVVGLMMLKRPEFMDPRPRRDPRLDMD